MSILFSDVLGESEHTFDLGTTSFKAAPVSLTEVSEWQAMEGRARDERHELLFDEQAEWIAQKLRSRLAPGQNFDPALITTDWVLERLTMPSLMRTRHVLLFGGLPQEGTPGKP